jgi:transmembrane sensor
MELRKQDEILALIARNLGGLADSDEVAQLKEWIESSLENEQFFEQVEEIWNASDKSQEMDETDLQAGMERVLKRINKVSPNRVIWNYWQKIAAILILPLAIGSLLWIYLLLNRSTPTNDAVYNEVYAAFGTRSALKLADSSLVWLNSGSSIRYPDKFTSKNRKVYLKGEAYFEIKSDISRPFIVQSSTLSVIATGTKFNVSDYYSNTVKEVTLVTGKVSVNKNSDKKPVEIVKLNPDQHLQFNEQTQEKKINQEDVYKYIAWKDGKLIFRNDPLSEVVKKIGRIYNVDIEIEGKELKEYRYRATFKDESLDEILKLLTLSSPINYREIKREPLPDGTFPPKRVILFKKTNTQ